MTERDIFAESGIKKIEQTKSAPISAVTGLPEFTPQPPAKARPLSERLADVPEKLYYKGKEFVRAVGEEVREQAPVFVERVKEAGKGAIEYAQEFADEEPVRTVVRKKAKKKSARSQRAEPNDTIYSHEGDDMYGSGEDDSMWGSTEIDLWGNRAERSMKNKLDEEVL